ncbi:MULTISPECIES: Fur family transcriptional regulator [Salegentibacter]|uniref:Transcriptional repressor n=1 Tax=Salegentibacter maritimus TaxID=2794347 RepID=A0ABS0TJ97_9FLAO|nr:MULTISPECIES: transcriptional repressor [Salegentibacter]MBE7640524.1 transcriptional repressor [Salegentibacter sp. BLCTC]MBI6115865.1 transcriptional repressor [Salegentibacter maritimus]MBI6120099.1 transcriptional repressor [Salegentibacter maritimus]
MEEIQIKLSERSIRPTAVRILVYDYLAKKNIASSLSDIEDFMGQSDRTTLYRTLKTFEEKGVVHQIDDGTGVQKYALCEEDCMCDPQDLHLHFHCVKCNETQCLTDRKIPHINLPKGFVVKDANLVVKGICDQCEG